MQPIRARVAAFLREQRVSRAAPLLVAVSGGADSLALLHVLAALGQRIAVAHVHHGLRGDEADADLLFVRERALEFGVPFYPACVDAARRDARSPEARARELRYAALDELRVRHGLDFVATAHSLEDQAETVLLRAIRGTGLQGLAGIRRVSGGRLRPLLDVRRADLRHYLLERGLSWREDSSNADLGVPRNRLRAQVLPLLEQIHAGAADRLAALAAHATELQAAWAPEIGALLDAALEPGHGGSWLDPAALLQLDRALRRRVLAEILGRAVPAERVSQLHIQRFEDFVLRSSAPRLSLPGARALVRDRDRIWLGPASGPRFPAPTEARLRPGAALEFPERRLRLTWHRDPVAARSEETLRVTDELAGRLRVRSPRAGDCISHGGRARRIGDLLSAARWSRRQRADALVVVLEGGGSREEVVWVPGLISAAQLGQVARRGWQLRSERLSTQAQSC